MCVRVCLHTCAIVSVCMYMLCCLCLLDLRMTFCCPSAGGGRAGSSDILGLCLWLCLWVCLQECIRASSKTHLMLAETFAVFQHVPVCHRCAPCHTCYMNLSLLKCSDFAQTKATKTSQSVTSPNLGYTS